MKKIFILTAVFTVLAFSSCKTVEEIPTNYSAAKIIQMGQSAYEAGDSDTAIMCYETVIERFGTDIQIFLEAKYEIGHVYLNQHKYQDAYNAYTEILNIYNSTFAGDLPGAYKKLAQIGLSQIPENKLSNLSEEE